MLFCCVFLCVRVRAGHTSYEELARTCRKVCWARCSYAVSLVALRLLILLLPTIEASAHMCIMPPHVTSSYTHTRTAGLPLRTCMSAAARVAVYVTTATHRRTTAQPTLSEQAVTQAGSHFSAHTGTMHTSTHTRHAHGTTCVVVPAPPVLIVRGCASVCPSHSALRTSFQLASRNVHVHDESACLRSTCTCTRHVQKQKCARGKAHTAWRLPS